MNSMAFKLQRLVWVCCFLAASGCTHALDQRRAPVNDQTTGVRDPFFRALISTPRLSPVLAKASQGSSHPLEPVDVGREDPYQVGIASYYGKRFHGRRTATGEIFNMWAMTAAHRALPMGTIVNVTNMENGRSVEVKVNDRGPFIKGRVLDLSYGAAAKLGMIRHGLAKVKIVVVDDPE